MRGTKRRSLFNTRQLIIIEVLLLANTLIVAVLGLLVLNFNASGRGLFPQASHFGLPSPTPTQSNLRDNDHEGDPLREGRPYPTTRLPDYSTTQLPDYPTTRLPDYPTTRLPDYTAGPPSSTPTSVVLGLSATPIPTQTPASVLLDVDGRPQTLPLSCEARSAVDWAAYFGTAIDELEFLSRLPLSDNPEVGFVGDVDGRWGQIPPNPYGVHAEPVAALLRDYGVAAQAGRGLSWEDIQAEISSGRPVILWVFGHVWAGGKPVEYLAADGTSVVVAPYEHTVMAIGYDAQANVLIRDGRKLYWRAQQTFLASWAALGNMAITMNDE